MFVMRSGGSGACVRPVSAHAALMRDREEGAVPAAVTLSPRRGEEGGKLGGGAGERVGPGGEQLLF